jgi:hypothetical protein
MASLANESMMRGDSALDFFSAARGAFEQSNYMADAMAAARSQHGMPSSQQQQQQSSLFGLQELANLRRQELFLQHAAAPEHRAGAMSSSLSSSGSTNSSLLYEHLLANELIRSQHALPGGGGPLGHQSMGSYAAQQFLGGLSVQDQAQSTLEQLLLLQHQQQSQQQLLAANFMQQPGMGDQPSYQNPDSTTVMGIQQRILAAQRVAALGGSAGGGFHQNDLLDRVRAAERDNQTQNDDDAPPDGRKGI